MTPGIRRLLVACAALGLLSGCTGKAPTLGTLPWSGVSSDQTGNGSAFEAATGTEGKADGFNPFDHNTTAPGGRDVIEQPTLPDVLVTGELPEMSLGRLEAPVTMVQYASLTCPHCRKFHAEVFPAFKKDYIDTGKVRFIMREFPIGKTSGNATIALRCAPPAKYFDLYGRYMESQPTWVSQEVRLDPIFAVAAKVGMTRAQFDACLQNQGMINALKWVKERGRKLGIIGTPNFFIQDKLIKSTLTMNDLRARIDPLLSGTTAAAPAN